MILVKRNEKAIPQKLLAMAAKAQSQLETLNEAERRDFIKKKSRIWRLFGRYLSRMSHGKCWYSESPDPQSFFDVDHYRPKLEAKRSESKTDKPGYEWLAFSWDNFRYAANCSNRVNENIETGAMDGKGSWFPLLDDTTKARWNNRCEADEKPVLLDPVEKADVALIDVGADGLVCASRLAVGSGPFRVKRSCELYGLNLPGIKAARLRLMREVTDMVEVLERTVTAGKNSLTPDVVADMLPIPEQCALISRKTEARSPYSKAARAVIFRAGYPELCAMQEETDGMEEAV